MIKKGMKTFILLLLFNFMFYICCFSFEKDDLIIKDQLADINCEVANKMKGDSNEGFIIKSNQGEGVTVINNINYDIPVFCFDSSGIDKNTLDEITNSNINVLYYLAPISEDENENIESKKWAERIGNQLIQYGIIVLQNNYRNIEELSLFSGSFSDKYDEVVLINSKDEESVRLSSWYWNKKGIPMLFTTSDKCVEKIKTFLQKKDLKKLYIVGNEEKIGSWAEEVFKNVERINFSEERELCNYIYKNYYENISDKELNSRDLYISLKEETKFVVMNAYKCTSNEESLSFILDLNSEIDDQSKNILKRLVNSCKNIYLLGEDFNNEETMKRVYKILDIKIEEEVKKEETQQNSNNAVCPTITPLTVMNISEGERAYIYAEPNYNSNTVGYTIGNNAEVKILKEVGEFSYIETIGFQHAQVIRGYVPKANLTTITPNSEYCILLDLGDQRIYVYQNGKKIKEIVCSSGRPGCDTPKGKFLLGYRGKWFGGSNYRCYNWVRIYDDYLFHSVLCNLDGSIMTYSLNNLGKKASDGCVRMDLETSKWFHETIPWHTLVVVQD